LFHKFHLWERAIIPCSSKSLIVRLHASYNYLSRIILIVQSIINKKKSNSLYLLLMSLLINIKNVFFFRKMSIINQNSDIIIAQVNGIQRILYENEREISPFNNARVARPMPQPGQGIFVANLNKQIE